MNGIFGADGWLNAAMTGIVNILWSYLLIWLLIGCGIWFTVRTRFVQFRMVGEMFRLLGDSAVSGAGKKHISSFQAFAVSVASRVGTGNLAGVATAIAIGGPGAVFWMWFIALIGAATAFVESTLAQLFKQPDGDAFIGGPAYYIKKGLHCKWMANLFAVLLMIAFGVACNLAQSNTICGAMREAFGVPPVAMGIAITVLTLVIVFGGIQRIAKVASVIVPVMAIGYFLIAAYVVVVNYRLIPGVVHVIFANAFGFGPAAGGGVGAAIMMGIRRGLFSNEAGEGSAPNAAATASTSHPVKQGLIQSLGVFTDTLLVCSCTAFVILISGLYKDPSLNGIVLTQNALRSEIGPAGPVFIAIAILLFAYSTIISAYYYGEANLRFLTRSRKALLAYRIVAGGGIVMLGAVASLEIVWNTVDLCMALNTACNLVAIVALGKFAFRLLDDYRLQKRRGIREPGFHRSQLPEIEKDIDCWK